MDRDWPDLGTEWTQADLLAWVRQMGINPNPGEIVPQGVKFIAFPQPPLTDAEIALGREIATKIQREGLKPIATIKRVRDPRRN